MDKYVMIGVNAFNRGCLLSCLLSFEQLDPDTLEASDFEHRATDWSGCDDLERIFEWKDLKPTGKEIVLKVPLVFKGYDDDHGHEYPWTMTVTKILEVTAI